MLVSAWIDKLTGQQRMVEDLTKKIAARCEAAVWSRIQPAAASMDPAQTRGYIRARASLVIHRETKATVDQIEDACPTLFQRVKESVSDTIVRQMISRVATQHPGELRRAA